MAYLIILVLVVLSGPASAQEAFHGTHELAAESSPNERQAYEPTNSSFDQAVELFRGEIDKEAPEVAWEAAMALLHYIPGRSDHVFLAAEKFRLAGLGAYSVRLFKELSAVAGSDVAANPFFLPGLRAFEEGDVTKAIVLMEQAWRHVSYSQEEDTSALLVLHLLYQMNEDEHRASQAILTAFSTGRFGWVRIWSALRAVGVKIENSLCETPREGPAFRAPRPIGCEDLIALLRFLPMRFWIPQDWGKGLEAYNSYSLILEAKGWKAAAGRFRERAIYKIWRDVQRMEANEGYKVVRKLAQDFPVHYSAIDKGGDPDLWVLNVLVAAHLEKGEFFYATSEVAEYLGFLGEISSDSRRQELAKVLVRIASRAIKNVSWHPNGIPRSTDRSDFSGVIVEDLGGQHQHSAVRIYASRLGREGEGFPYGMVSPSEDIVTLSDWWREDQSYSKREFSRALRRRVEDGNFELPVKALLGCVYWRRVLDCFTYPGLGITLRDVEEAMNASAAEIPQATIDGIVIYRQLLGLLSRLEGLELDLNETSASLRGERQKAMGWQGAAGELAQQRDWAARDWIERGRVLLNSGLADEAVVASSRAIQLEPDNEVALMLHAEVLDSLGKYEAELGIYQRLQALGSSNGKWIDMRRDLLRFLEKR